MENTALVPVEQRAVVALNSTETEKHLAVLATKHNELTVIKNKDAREQVHGAAMELLKARTSIEKVSKTARDDATKFSKAVIAEEKRLIGIIDTEEKRLFALRDEWDAEQERIKQEKIEAEQRRVAAITELIEDFANAPVRLAGSDSVAIETELLFLQLQEPTEEKFEEFLDKAKFVLTESIAKLTELLAAAKAQEKAAKQLAAEQARLEAERSELERQRRELEEARARAAAEAAMAAQRALDEASAKAKAEAAQRAAFEQQQRDAFEEEKRQAEATLKAAQDAVAAERAEIAKAKAVEAAKEAEAQRKAREKVEQDNAENVLEAVVDYAGCTEEMAIQKIIRAAVVLSASAQIPEAV